MRKKLIPDEIREKVSIAVEKFKLKKNNTGINSLKRKLSSLEKKKDELLEIQKSIKAKCFSFCCGANTLYFSPPNVGLKDEHYY